MKFLLATFAATVVGSTSVFACECAMKECMKSAKTDTEKTACEAKKTEGCTCTGKKMETCGCKAKKS